MEKKSLRRKSPQRAERLTRGKDAPSQGGADPLSSLQSPKIDSPPPDGQGFVRIRSTYRLKGAKPLVPEDAANAFTTNLRRISVIRVERVQSGAQKVSSKRLLQHQDSRYEGASQPKNPSSFLIIELEILRILGIEETQLEAIRKLPMKRARETCERLLAEHPQEVEKLKKAIEPAWEEAWREAKKALDASARKPQTTEEILTWTEYEQRYQRNKEEVVEALPEGDLDALFYYLPFYGPRLLAEGPISAVVQGWWFERTRNKGARENWRELLAALGWEGHGRFKEPGPKDRQQSKRDAVSKSNAAQALLNKHENYKKQGRSPLDAYKLVERQHGENTKIKDPERKKRAFRSFRKRAMEKDPDLRKTLLAKGW